MAKDIKDKNLQREAERLQYSLRSTFFYRRRIKFKEPLEAIDRLDPSRYAWPSPQELGISKSAWEYVKNKGIPYHKVFYHPDIIIEDPHLITYYRSIALLPQKGAQRLAFGVKDMEEGRGGALSRERATLLAKLFNTYICTLIDGDPNFSLEDVLITGLMNFGTQLNGSWRNEIGTEGARRVKEMVLKHFLSKRAIRNIILKDGSHLRPSTSLPPIDELREFTLSNGNKIIIGSEPDISHLNPSNILEGAIEVKVGLDPAGALERYGAAKRSFDRALEENKSAVTIYLASCITKEVRRRISRDRSFKKDFDLTGVLVTDTTREEFLNYLQWLVHL